MPYPCNFPGEAATGLYVSPGAQEAAEDRAEAHALHNRATARLARAYDAFERRYGELNDADPESYEALTQAARQADALAAAIEKLVGKIGGEG